MIQSVGKIVQLRAVFSQHGKQGIPVKDGKIPDGVDLKAVEHIFCRVAYIQQISHRQGPDNRAEIFSGDLGGGIGFAIVAAQFGKYLVEGHSNGNGDTQFTANSSAYGIGQRHRIAAEQMYRAGHIQPALVNAEGFHQIGVLLIDGVDPFGHFRILFVMGGEKDMPWRRRASIR